MMKEEKVLGQELSALEKRFDSWLLTDCGGQDMGAHPALRSAPPHPASSARDVTVDLPPEVAAFEV